MYRLDESVSYKLEIRRNDRAGFSDDSAHQRGRVRQKDSLGAAAAAVGGLQFVESMAAAARVPSATPKANLVLRFLRDARDTVARVRGEIGQ